MSSREQFVELICKRMAGAGEIRARKMFGDYGVYCDGKLFALICDNKLFIKPTDAGREFLVTPQEKQPYPGAKNYFLIEDAPDVSRALLAELVRITCAALPAACVKKQEKK